MFRSVLAVAGGYVVMAVVVALTTWLLGIIFPAYAATQASATMPLLPVLLSVVSGLIAAMAGGYTSAAIAARSPRAHALGLAVLIVVLGLAYAAAGWSGPSPRWYLIVLPIAGAIGALLGGALHDRSTGKRIITT